MAGEMKPEKLLRRQRDEGLAVEKEVTIEIIRTWDRGLSRRDHHNAGFSIWLCGGGIRPGYIYGATDEVGYTGNRIPNGKSRSPAGRASAKLSAMFEHG